eukprot:4054389-Pleurochrysis_carterae.AAC.1
MHGGERVEVRCDTDTRADAHVSTRTHPSLERRRASRATARARAGKHTYRHTRTHTQIHAQVNMQIHTRKYH